MPQFPEYDSNLEATKLRLLPQLQSMEDIFPKLRAAIEQRDRFQEKSCLDAIDDQLKPLTPADRNLIWELFPGRDAHSDLEVVREHYWSAAHKLSFKAH